MPQSLNILPFYLYRAIYLFFADNGFGTVEAAVIAQALEV